MLMSHLTTKESSDLNVAMMMEQRAPTEWRSRKMLLCIAAFGLILWSSLVAVGITLYIVSANANSNELKCCPSGWSKSPYGTKCLYFSSKQLSWSDASRYCQKFDAQLLSIHSDRESEMIRRFIPNDFPDTGIWLGGGTKNPDAGINGWYWLDPIPFDFENWVDGKL
uniref:C-type lectin domain-containing protein n=1 Tax=Plectus sambesii TaxID=2011161 RepID=A0A914X4Z4_9BILA